MKNKNLYVTGHTGMPARRIGGVGSAITHKYKVEGYTNIFTRDFPGYDLTN